MATNNSKVHLFSSIGLLYFFQETEFYTKIDCTVASLFNNLFLDQSAQTATAKERLVLGTAGLGGVWGAVDEQESVNTILYALEKGITHIDTAASYGEAERLTGIALRQWKGKKPVISTKAGRLKADNAFDFKLDFSPSGLIRTVSNSLTLLELDHIDLLLLHEPQLIPAADLQPAIDTLIQLREEGVVKNIGLGGNLTDSFRPYVQQGIFKTCIGFNRYDACCMEGLADEIPFLLREGADYYAASPLHMGLLGKKLDEFKTSRPAWLSVEALQVAALLEVLAQKESRSLVGLALAFLKASSVAAKVIIGPSNMQEATESLDAWNSYCMPENIFNTICLLNKRPDAVT